MKLAGRKLFLEHDDAVSATKLMESADQLHRRTE
ncbi:hypothetical protein O9929_22265 [Vibrio lentus]|nr:hypothetical protein [Vibrio lentus]